MVGRPEEAGPVATDDRLETRGAGGDDGNMHLDGGTAKADGVGRVGDWVGREEAVRQEDDSPDANCGCSVVGLFL